MKFPYYIFIICIFTFSCTKQEIIKETVVENGNSVVKGNTAPPDNTIENVILENYVSKLYISLLSRKPDSTEFANDIQKLRNTNLSIKSKSEVITAIMNKPEYFTRLYEIARQQLLNGADTNQIQQNLLGANSFLAGLDSAANSLFYTQVKNEVLKSNALLTIESGLKSQSLSVIDMHKICINNLIYSDINMGTENFVVSMYQNFLFRSPTIAEEDASEKMVDGTASAIFLKEGTSKDDFIRIFFDSSEYFEGQVRSNFLRYILREPTTSEIVKFANQYKSDLNYKNLQIQILSIPEYVGN